MLFNSLHFLVFFPVVTLLYFVLPHKVRWVWLLAASYYFYMSWNAKYALLILTSTAITFVSGLLIDRSNKLADEKKRNFQRKLWVALSFISNLSILFFFKYFDFAVGNLNRILGVVGITALSPSFDVLLPVGISFYTFQALSYTMDVYRDDIYAERNFFKYALFVSFFPQLVAGPIERSKNLLVQINERHYFEYDRVKDGLLLMMWGLFEKIVVADRVAVIVNQLYDNYEQYPGSQLVWGTMLFAVQIYCDFAGYSDIATGAAQVMGFRLMQNFRRPYFATSIREFWQRWHISLSTWFRDYLYIPLGGNRKGKLRKYFNTMVTFLVSGLWHGASWNFVAWGFLHGFFQVAGEVLKPLREKVLAFFRVDTTAFSHRVLRALFTFGLTCFAWIFFRAPGASVALGILRQMVTNFDLLNILNYQVIFDLGLSFIDLRIIMGGLVTLFIVNVMQETLAKKESGIRALVQKQNLWFRWTLYLLGIFGILLVCIYYYGGPSQQFIYFQF